MNGMFNSFSNVMEGPNSSKLFVGRVASKLVSRPYSIVNRNQKISVILVQDYFVLITVIRRGNIEWE